jgi:transposase-like protein
VGVLSYIGLRLRAFKLIITDGYPRLFRALEIVYPYVPRQRCWAHKLRNVASKLREKHQEECPSGVKLIYYDIFFFTY